MQAGYQLLQLFLKKFHLAHPRKPRASTGRGAARSQFPSRPPPRFLAPSFLPAPLPVEALGFRGCIWPYSENIMANAKNIEARVSQAREVHISTCSTQQYVLLVHNMLLACLTTCTLRKVSEEKPMFLRCTNYDYKLVNCRTAD